MIKEKKKKSKYNKTQTRLQILQGYVRTIICSMLIAAFFTFMLANHARNEMLKDIFAENKSKNLVDKQLALELIANPNTLKDLENKNYSVCYHTGELYETIEDYEKAQIAYELAIQKAKKGNLRPYYKLVEVLAAQEKFEQAFLLIDSIKDFSDKDLIKFKTRSYIVIGDKYYSIGKVLSAAKAYEKADFYYSKFVKRDKEIEKSIKNRIIDSYIQVADIMVKSGMNTDAMRFLTKAESYDPKSIKIRYKMAVVLADLDPEKSVKYFEDLLEESPQQIDYGVFGYALMKAANIADLDGRPTQAKYYRYKIHSVDMFVNRKVIYKNDIDVILKKCNIKKEFFTYPINLTYEFVNISHSDIINLYADFVLEFENKDIETISKQISNKNNPLLSYNDDPNIINVNFKKKIFTKKELENYYIKIFLYKDKKYKTLVSRIRIPQKTNIFTDIFTPIE